MSENIGTVRAAVRAAMAAVDDDWVSFRGSDLPAQLQKIRDGFFRIEQEMERLRKQGEADAICMVSVNRAAEIAEARVKELERENEKLRGLVEKMERAQPARAYTFWSEWKAAEARAKELEAENERLKDKEYGLLSHIRVLSAAKPGAAYLLKRAEAAEARLKALGEAVRELHLAALLDREGEG